jgi:hypothetical protein
MAGEPENDQDGLLPLPDPTEMLRLATRGSASDRRWWCRLLPAGLFSVGVHLFFLPFLLLIIVAFSESDTSTNETPDNHYKFIDDYLGEINLNRGHGLGPREEDRLIAVSLEKPGMLFDPSDDPNAPTDQRGDKAPTPQRPAGGVPGTINFFAQEKFLLDHFNQWNRAKKGFKPNATLYEVARTYAALMAKAKNLECLLDDGLDGKDTLQRVEDAGYKMKHPGETSLGFLTCSGRFAPVSWSSPCKTGIGTVLPESLDTFEEIGIGVARYKDCDYFISYVIFAIPAK